MDDIKKGGLISTEPLMTSFLEGPILKQYYFSKSQIVLLYVLSCVTADMCSCSLSKKIFHEHKLEFEWTNCFMSVACI